MAEGWTPGGKVGSGKNSGSTLAKAILELGTRIKVFLFEVKGASMMIAEAALSSAREK